MANHSEQDSTKPGDATSNVHRARKAILDAAVDTLQERGYAGTSVRAVARSAGVSQGALQHHFPTKHALVEAALLRLGQQLVEQAQAKLPETLSASIAERCVIVLNTLWDIHNLPVAHAITELLAAARTDNAIRTSVSAATDDAHALTVAIAAQALPELATAPGFADWILTCVATMRGLVVLANLDAPAQQLAWEQSRAHLLAAVDQLGMSPARSR